jgi:hypothetical protein
MVQVYEEPISRRHYAPYFSVAFLYRPFCVGRERTKNQKYTPPYPTPPHTQPSQHDAHTSRVCVCVCAMDTTRPAHQSFDILIQFVAPTHISLFPPSKPSRIFKYLYGKPTP